MSKKAIVLDRNVKIGKVIVKAGTKIPANHENYDELVQFAGGNPVAVAIEETEVLNGGDDVTVDSFNKDQIMAMLKTQEVEFDAKAKKDVLFLLLKEMWNFDAVPTKDEAKEILSE